MKQECFCNKQDNAQKFVLSKLHRSSEYYFNSHQNFLNSVIVVFAVVRVEKFLSRHCSSITFSKAFFFESMTQTINPFSCIHIVLHVPLGVSKFSFLNHFTLKYIHAPFHSFSFFVFFLFIVDVVVAVMEMYRQKQNEKKKQRKRKCETDEVTLNIMFLDRATLFGTSGGEGEKK